MALPPPDASGSDVDLRGGPRKRMIAIGAVALLGVGGITAGMLVYRGGGSSEAAETEAAKAAADAAPAFDYGQYAGSIKSLRTILKHRPCDSRNAIELGETLNRAGDHEGAIKLVDDYNQSCGELRRILWVKVAANEDLKRWDRVVEVTTTLIKGAPHDSDYWWWRGRAEENLEHAELAASDYRHSVARGPNRYGSSRFAKLVREEQPCEGAFALHSYMSRSKSSPPWAMRDFQDLYLAGDCDHLAGKGGAELEFQPDAPVMKVPAEINGVKGTFLVEREAAFLTVSEEFAGKAKIEPAGETKASIFVAGRFADASLATAGEAALGKGRRKAKAADVAVAIVDKLPSDADGVIGESLLWRFQVEWKADRLVLGPLATGS